MNDIPHKSESGQAIVYLVIGLVVFLGFVALAIDGGMALADRRHEQNAADAASLAGGGKVALDLEAAYITIAKIGTVVVSDSHMSHGEDFAITRAANNNFTISKILVVVIIMWMPHAITVVNTSMSPWRSQLPHQAISSSWSSPMPYITKWMLLPVSIHAIRYRLEMPSLHLTHRNVMETKMVMSFL